MDEKQKYIIQGVNNTEDNSLVEIIYEESLLAELVKKDSRIEITFYDMPSTSIDANVFLLAVQAAIKDAKTLPN
jgi:hypothetical protein